MTRFTKISDLARCERSRVSRRGAIASLVVGVAVAGLGAQIVAEREILYERKRRRRPYAQGVGARKRAIPV